MANEITVYTGLPASGKTSALIDEMRRYQQDGGKVLLFLSSEHEELTRRPNVKPGGMMGCRTPGTSFKIDYVCDTNEASKILEQLEGNTLAVFDEAQFFRPSIVESWQQAATRGMKILVGSPSQLQLDQLKGTAYKAVQMEVGCGCKMRTATRVIYKDDLVYPTHLCDACYQDHWDTEIDALLEDVKTQEPFPGEKHTYQPFYGIDMKDWALVRSDSKARLDIILDALERSPSLQHVLSDPVSQPTYLDLGCCSGFFNDGMATRGFRSTGVDVTKNFISWANRLAQIKGQYIEYVCADAYKYLVETEKEFDITSTFATIQWVMVQKGYDTGINCFKALFRKTRAIAVVEMGYTKEEIYKNKIQGLSGEIDKDWVLDMMRKHGNFASIEVHHAGENGIWRDVFVGFKEGPTERPFRASFKNESTTPVSDITDYWEDGWVGPSFEVYLRAEKVLTLVRLKGWRPEKASTAEKSIITVGINGHSIGGVTATGGGFACQQDIAIEKNDVFRLSIDCTTIEDVPEDRRNLSFVLAELSFW